MDLPENTLLPMFAYGVFQPGDLAFLRVKEFVSSATAASVSGALCVRDGLPLLDPENSGRVHGALLDFRPQAAGRAYYRVVELEPDKQYEWRTLDVVTSTTQVPANTLVGRDLKNGTVPFENEDDRWHGSEDPFFKEALEVVAGTLPPESQGVPHNDFHLLFRVQMGYLLLWSVLERYTALRYHLAGKVMGKVKPLAQEQAFVDGLRQNVREERTVYRADDPGEKCRLRVGGTKPKDSLKYYYQVRSNVTHRGKAAVQDFHHLLPSARELLAITKHVVDAAFEDAKWAGDGERAV